MWQLVIKIYFPRLWPVITCLYFSLLQLLPSKHIFEFSFFFIFKVFITHTCSKHGVEGWGSSSYRPETKPERPAELDKVWNSILQLL